MSRNRTPNSNQSPFDDESAPLLNQPGRFHDRLVENRGLGLPMGEGLECELLISSSEPDLARLDEIPATHAAYIRYKNSLYYANKKTGELIHLAEVKEKALLNFDLELGLRDPFKKMETYRGYSSRPLPLSNSELNKIILLTGHVHPQVNPRLPEEELSTWREKNGCDLLVSNTPPAEQNLDELPISNAAYLRYRNELWYVRKKRNWLEKIFFKERTLLKLTEEELARFDLVMKTTSSQHQHLTDKDLAKIVNLTDHAHKTLWQGFLSSFGHFCSAFIAVGCGVSTAGTFIALNLATGGLAAVGAALLFAASTAVNWWIFKRYVSPVLVDLFGREKFLIDEAGEPLSIWKKLAMGIALTLSLSVGATFAALTYSSTFTLTTAFTFLGAISPALPFIAAGLAGVTLICMTALMIKDISDLIKKKDIIGECTKFLKNLVSTDPELAQNKGKGRGRILAERIASVVMTAVFLPLACLGLYMTMNACAPGVKAILLEKIPGLSSTVAEVTANVISLGLAFIGQIPFGIQTAFQTIGKIFSPKTKEFVPANQQETTGAKAWKGVKLFSVGINALGNGLISMMGAVGSLFRALALASGTGNSAFAGVPAVLGSEPAKAKLPVRSIDDLYLANKNRQLETLVVPLPSPAVSSSSISSSGYNSYSSSQSSPVASNPNALFGSRNTVEMMPLQQARLASEVEQEEEKSQQQRRPLTHSADDMSISYRRMVRV